MRYLTPICLCLALAACGGDFSNDDLEFQNALPRREDLMAKVLGQEQAKARALRVASKVHALRLGRLGEASGIVGDTSETGRDFNDSVGNMLQAIENIRTQPATSRGPNRRVWGPFLGKNDMKFDTRFVMTREGGRFDYHLQLRDVGEGEGDWWSFLSGQFEATGGVRRGTGGLILDLKRSREEGYLGVDVIDRQEIHYQTQTFPTRVELVWTFADTTRPLPSRYVYREGEGGVAEMTFELAQTDFVLGGLKEDMALTTRWAPDGRGLGAVEILKGDIPGAKYTECWDAQGKVTFISRSWDIFNPTEGVRASCPDLSALDR
ncbi:hypothetical protein [Myxococcus sp. AB025B]|uniref:hypothetical protein n=1 Tax=Myxococcus sp. AB025B TaxID=2562794 RepID=UPI001E2E5BD8|nr:hypothetical protein [Myxococcus sp. AB025B]